MYAFDYFKPKNSKIKYTSLLVDLKNKWMIWEEEFSKDLLQFLSIFILI